MSASQRLRIIHKELNLQTATGSVEVIPFRSNQCDGHADIQILEEDCWQILSSQTVLKNIEYHPIRVMTDMINQKPLTPGDLLIKGKQWLAIVYDLDKNPICKPEWISQILERILTSCETYRIRSIMIPLLGCTHGDIDWQKSLDLMTTALHIHEGVYLKRVYLRVEDDQLEPLLKVLINCTSPAK